MTGGVAGGHKLRAVVRSAQKRQKAIVDEGKSHYTRLQTQQSFGGDRKAKKKIAVDWLFFQRLVSILHM